MKMTARLVNKNATPELHISIPMALSPIPGHVEAREYREAQVTTAAKEAMNGAAPLKGPLSISLGMSYPPRSSMRKGHGWRVTSPTCWDLSRFILPLLQGIVFVSAAQVAKLEVTKTYGAKPLTVITVKPLVE
jgi:Holliday junction resolvase RusA-like endonuclease